MTGGKEREANTQNYNKKKNHIKTEDGVFSGI